MIHIWTILFPFYPYPGSPKTDYFETIQNIISLQLQILYNTKYILNTILHNILDSLILRE